MKAVRGRRRPQRKYHWVARKDYQQRACWWRNCVVVKNNVTVGEPDARCKEGGVAEDQQPTLSHQKMSETRDDYLEQSFLLYLLIS